MLEIASPSGNGSLLHLHSKEAEGFYVIDGEFSYQYQELQDKVFVVLEATKVFQKPRENQNVLAQLSLPYGLYFLW
jgi:uncharacterized cupin superfamily protein